MAVFGLTVASAEEDPAPLVLAAVPTATPPAPERVGDQGSLTLVVEETTVEPESPDEPPIPPDADDPAVAEIVAVEEVLPGPGDDDVTVEIRASLCPEDVAAIADDIAALTGACPTPGAFLTPLLNQEGVTTPGLTDASGGASWADRTLGTAYLALNLPPESGMPIVFCRDDLPGSDWVRYTVTGSTDQAAIAAELTVPGAWFVCSWYIPPAPRSLTIQAWTCPVEIVASNEDVADFFDACTDPIDGLGFRLDTGSGILDGHTAGGTAVWDGLPLAPILIEGGQPEGFGRPAVFCASDGSVAYTPYPAPASSMVYDLTGMPGVDHLCHWFVIPDQGQVSVTKRVCPYGIDDSSEDFDYFVDTCQEMGDGVHFHLLKGGLDLPQVFVKAEVWIGWDGLSGGTATVWEEIPSGFVQPVVFCSARTAPVPMALSYDLIPTNDGRIELEFGESYLHYECHWYNIPGDPNDNDGWLDVTTYACPAGAIADVAAADAATFAAACPAAQDGIPVTLELGDGHAPLGATTGEAGPGRIFFPLPDGTYSEVSLSEDLPAEVTDSAVFCRYDGPASEPHPETEWGDGANWLDLEPGTTALCDWFNVVAPDGGGEDGGEDKDEGDDGPGGGSDDGGGDEGPDESDGSGDGADVSDEPGSGASIEAEQPVVVTLPDTGAGALHGTSPASMDWGWALAALGAAMGLIGGIWRPATERAA